MPATWLADLVDVNGRPLTEGGLTLASAGVLTEQSGAAPKMFQCLVPLDAEQAEVLGGDDEIDAYVKLYRTIEGGNVTDRILKFYGSVWVDEIQGAAGVLMLTALDQLAVLAKRYTDAQFPPTDLGEMLKQMVDTTNSTDGDTGIRTNGANITASSSIDTDLRSNRPTVLSMADQFSGLLDGCETWLEPIELDDGKIGDLHVAPRRGTTSAAVFGFGPGTDDNCSDMGRTRDKMNVENDAHGYSDVLTSNRYDATSIAALRRLVGYTSFTGETSQDALDARTQGRLGQRSTRGRVAEYRAALASNAPVLYDDYNIGDDVTLQFRKGRIAWDVQQRAVMAKVKLVPSANGLIEQPDSVEFRGAVD